MDTHSLDPSDVRSKEVGVQIQVRIVRFMDTHSLDPSDIRPKEVRVQIQVPDSGPGVQFGSEN